MASEVAVLSIVVGLILTLVCYLSDRLRSTAVPAPGGCKLTGDQYRERWAGPELVEWWYPDDDGMIAKRLRA